TIASFEKKRGRERPPPLFDLTSLQVHCNKRFAYSADQTLKLVQNLYEKKLVTYPRVDTTYLPNDMYPKISGILGKLTNYQQLTQPLLGKKIRKSTKVFNDKKVTDHHAIIPTGIQQALGTPEQNVYDAIARQFIAAFYPDCIVNNTTVLGESEKVEFKATGKEIVEEGWRVVFPKKKQDSQTAGDPKDDKKEDKILPIFTQGETGPHDPSIVEKETKPPKNYTEATLLRAMETAGKKVDDDELRELMKANGIGRPSTRANIIETLFKRKYIERQKKLIIPTETGIQLIQVIQNELLKSAELTGQWEKQLREIEDGEYSAGQFIRNMKVMVNDLVNEVIRTQSYVRISATAPPVKTADKKPSKSKGKVSASELTCPKCREGSLLKGKAAYGCSRYKEGCDFRLPFVFMEKKIPETQIIRLVNKGSSVELKGFKKEGKKLTGKILLNDANQLEFMPKPDSSTPEKKPKTDSSQEAIPCPKCGIGTVMKGKTAYGCSRWKHGCDFRFPFDEIRAKANGQPLTKELVLRIIRGG
ncbi:MAG: DNA topoisomerase III, partial [Bacteroidetes bacterium]|nr:DNA topoisomerase III [Bacteroidota bacterium]